MAGLHSPHGGITSVDAGSRWGGPGPGLGHAYLHCAVWHVACTPRDAKLVHAAGSHQPPRPCPAPCSGTLVLTCGKDNLLRCVDARRFEVRCVDLHPLKLRRWAGSGAAQVPAGWGAPGSNLTLHAAAPQVLHTLSAPSFSVGGAWAAACLSPTEQQAAAGGADGVVFLWDLARSAVAARLREPKQHQPAVACAWSPLGLPLVSCDKAGTLSFWTGGPAKRGAAGGGGL